MSSIPTIGAKESPQKPLNASCASDSADLRLHRIEAKFIKGNDASLHVMERCGMTFEGYLRESMLVKGTYVTVGICSILADEWKSK